jgi:hypothetical protein
LSLSYRIILMVAMIVALALTFAAFVFSYLAAVSAESFRCAGQALVVDYRNGALDLFGFPVFGALCAAGLVVVWNSLKRESTGRLLASADSIAVFEFLSVRIGLGLVAFIANVGAVLFMIGMTTRFCVIRYTEISNYCYSANISG